MRVDHPDKPLVIKCTHERRDKKISFASARNCSYDVLSHKIMQCFSLSNFTIEYKDDNGEICDIGDEDQLSDAIGWAAAAEEAPTSSAASTSSSRSSISSSRNSISYSRSSKKRITLRVQIQVEYEGPNLSDSGSIASMDDYRPPAEESYSFRAGDLEDDAVTVSSRDTRGRLSPPTSSHNRDRSRSRRNSPLPGRASQLSGESSWDAVSRSSWDALSRFTRQAPSHTSRPLPTPPNNLQNTFSDSTPEPVFERLRQEDEAASTNYDPITTGQLNANWLKEQKERAFRSLGVLPDLSDPSVSDGSSLILEQEDGVGDLSLKRASTGYYYELDPSIAGGINGKPRPTSRQLNWVAAQQQAVTAHKPHPSTHHTDPSLDTIIPAELLQDIPPTPPGEEDLTCCSECGSLLDSMKYVCYTCGEKEPGSFLQTPASPSSSKGKHRDSSPSAHSRVYSSTLSPTFSSSSKTFVGQQRVPPRSHVDASSPTLLASSFQQKERGYELCHKCFEGAGVTHAIESVAALGSSPINLSRSLDNVTTQWRRAAPQQKGQLRHAFLEKMWGHGGWDDVVQSDAKTVDCSGCDVTTSLHKLYKCAACRSYYLCRACYSQVHDLHPLHAFLVLRGKSPRSLSDSSSLAYSTMLNSSEEQSLVHAGVRCVHCLMEIVGARFHCGECYVDICSNCESAGLPGNIDSADGGHISSHILIKIPLPLPSSKVQVVSRKAMTLWTRDPANVNRVGNSKTKSEISSYARTVIGTENMHTAEPTVNEDHGIPCSACRKPISGVRYQCANCPAPSLESSYSLCASCEEVSYAVHDPYHAFFKLPRLVHRPITSNAPILPVLYRMPAGPVNAVYPTRDPAGYLRSIIHSSAVCDLCFTKIEGAWFHCAQCEKDLCSSCEPMDTHDDTHVFLVFKALINMERLRSIMVEGENSDLSLPILNYPVYSN